MIYELYARGHQARRGAPNNGASGLLRTIRDRLSPSLAALHRVQWSAPWDATTDTKVKA